MKSAVVQAVSLFKSLARGLHLFCQICGKETPHQFRAAGSWEEYVCPVCGNVQAFKVR